MNKPWSCTKSEWMTDCWWWACACVRMQVIRDGQEKGRKHFQQHGMPYMWQNRTIVARTKWGKSRQCACQHRTKLPFWWESIDSWIEKIDSNGDEQRKRERWAPCTGSTHTHTESSVSDRQTEREQQHEKCVYHERGCVCGASTLCA